MIMTFKHIQQSVARYTPEQQAEPDRIRSRASVALILSGEESDLHVCLIRRTTRDSDTWSGHMAFPGGRASEDDPHAQAVAMRETHEEVGVILEDAHALGALDEIDIYGAGEKPSGVLSPFVFLMPGELPTLTPDPREVAEAYWVPIRTLCAPESFATYEFVHPKTLDTMTFPGITHQEHIIWGLTYRVFSQFAELMRWPMPGM